MFTPTYYGQLIYSANEAYSRGDYDGAADLWREVLKLNANYNMAFIGVARSLLRQGEYAEAMSYFKMAHDRENYGKAFRLSRKEWVEENITWIMVVVIAVVVLALIRSAHNKMKAEVAAYERDRIKK